MFGFLNKKDNIKLSSPLTGEVIQLKDVPDEVFSKKIVGDGIAIKPTEGRLVAPVDASIKQIFPTKHAVGLETEEGIEILIHIGIDTVELDGEGFKQLAEVGSAVKRGDELIQFDLDYIKENATSTITPILITNMDKIKDLKVANDGNVVSNSNTILNIEI